MQSTEGQRNGVAFAPSTLSREDAKDSSEELTKVLDDRYNAVAVIHDESELLALSGFDH